MAVPKPLTEHITLNLTLEELAKISHLSCSHFQQKFKKQVGIGPRHYINNQKIEYFPSLLMIGDIGEPKRYSGIFLYLTVYTPFKGLTECQPQSVNHIVQTNGIACLYGNICL